MEHKGTVKIETERLVLRKFVMEDADSMFRNWHSDEKVTEFLRWKPVKTVQETESVLNQWILSYEDKSFYLWAIELKEINEPIGSISVVGKDETVNKIHIGYALSKKWWNHGITTEAFKAVIPFFFLEVGANRIESSHDPNNPKSGKVMAKCGLQYEGTLRENDWSNKGIVDAMVYGLLRNEWEQREAVTKKFDSDNIDEI